MEFSVTFLVATPIAKFVLVSFSLSHKATLVSASHRFDTFYSADTMYDVAL